MTEEQKKVEEMKMKVALKTINGINSDEFKHRTTKEKELGILLQHEEEKKHETKN